MIRTVETFARVSVFPTAFALGSGEYALDLGVNLYELLFCSAGYLIGALAQGAGLSGDVNVNRNNSRRLTHRSVRSADG